jgi:hypothetical protein
VPSQQREFGRALEGKLKTKWQFYFLKENRLSKKHERNMEDKENSSRIHKVTTTYENDAFLTIQNKRKYSKEHKNPRKKKTKKKKKKKTKFPFHWRNKIQQKDFTTFFFG